MIFSKEFSPLENESQVFVKWAALSSKIKACFMTQEKKIRLFVIWIEGERDGFWFECVGGCIPGWIKEILWPLRDLREYSEMLDAQGD